MNRIVGAIAATCIAAAPVAVGLTASPSHAGPGCVTAGEFRNTGPGPTLVNTERRFGTHGVLDYQGGGFKQKSYRACYGPSSGRVFILYTHHHDAWRIYDKSYDRNGGYYGD